MIRKVFKTGNSSVISLPGDYLEALDVGVGSEVIVHLDRRRKRLIVSPAPEKIEMAGVDAEFARQVSDFVDRYRSILSALAEDA